MRQLVSGAILVFLIAGANGRAQNKAVEEQAVRKLPQAFCDAWAKHDGHALSKIMAEDVDFVTVGALWLHGRTNFEKYHARLLTGRFKDATVTTLQTSVRFLRPDMAVVHWSWTIQGDRNIDGTPAGDSAIHLGSEMLVTNSLQLVNRPASEAEMRQFRYSK
jgi:uncharacterized protein (TIGR02246 family)